MAQSLAEDVWNRLGEVVIGLGGVEGDLHVLTQDKGQPIINTFARLLVRAGIVERNLYPVKVIGDDYAEVFTSLIAREKNWKVNPSITPVNFPGVCISDFIGTLVHLDRDIKSDDAIREMDDMGVRPATMLEMLAFGAMYPEIQLEFPIVELSCSWFGRWGSRHIGYLCSQVGMREVRTRHWTDIVPANYRFLAVR